MRPCDTNVNADTRTSSVWLWKGALILPRVHKYAKKELEPRNLSESLVGIIYAGIVSISFDRYCSMLAVGVVVVARTRYCAYSQWQIYSPSLMYIYHIMYNVSNTIIPHLSSYRFVLFYAMIDRFQSIWNEDSICNAFTSLFRMQSTFVYRQHKHNRFRPANLYLIFILRAYSHFASVFLRPSHTPTRRRLYSITIFALFSRLSHSSFCLFVRLAVPCFAILCMVIVHVHTLNLSFLLLIFICYMAYSFPWNPALRLGNGRFCRANPL